MIDVIKSHEKLWSEWRDKNLELEIEKHLYERRPFLNILVKHAESLQRDGQILKTLEGGCGTAIDSYYLVNALENCEAYAVDIIDEAIEIADRIGGHFDKKIKLFKYDAMKMDFPDRFFDIVFSQGLIEHFKDPAPVLKESLRVLKDRGLLLISVPQKYSLYTIFKKIKMCLGGWQHGWEREYGLRDFKKMSILYGLETVEFGGYGSFFNDILSKFISIKKVFNKPAKIGSPYFSKNIFAVFKRTK